jgi:hypothetical protein
LASSSRFPHSSLESGEALEKRPHTVFQEGEGLAFMPPIQESLDRYDLCRQVVAEPDPAQRAEVIAHVRSLIEEERRTPQPPENCSYLRVAEMVLDFLEETLNSRYHERVQ